jgi:hypothetical protein
MNDQKPAVDPSKIIEISATVESSKPAETTAPPITGAETITDIPASPPVNPAPPIDFTQTPPVDAKPGQDQERGPGGKFASRKKAKDGTFRGRPMGAKNLKNRTQNNEGQFDDEPSFDDIQPESTPSVEQVETDYKMLAETLFNMSTGTLCMLLGPEWQAREIQIVKQPGGNDVVYDEKRTVCSALEVYLRSKQATDLPPGMILTMVCIAYAAPRIQAPSTNERLKLAWAWVKRKWSGFRRKKES